MEILTAAYLALTGLDAASLPLWDLIPATKLCGLLTRWVNGRAREARMREQHRWFAELLIRALIVNPHRYTWYKDAATRTTRSLPLTIP
jgi:hypothetical protein